MSGAPAAAGPTGPLPAAGPAGPWDSALVEAWCAASVRALTEHQQEIDDLNVFPIPDGDTGTNMLLTLRAAADALAASVADGAGLSAAGAFAAMARGGLHGARGNSGVLLSQLLRGLAEAPFTAPVRPAQVLAAGLSRAVALAYGAVAEPVEGTILTVARAAADAATAHCAQRPPAAAGGATAARYVELVAVARAACGAAEEALADTPRLLPALARAGVVDAGGRGLVVLLGALRGVLAGDAPPPQAVPRPRDRHALERAREQGSETFGYEVQYLLAAPDEAVATLRAELAGLGDSLVVVGSGTGDWNVHVHVNDVGAAIEAGIRAGRPSSISVVRFADQIAAQRSAGRSGRAVVALAPGEGLGQLFAAERVTVVDGGPASSPAIADVLSAIHRTEAAEVVVLPNHRSVTAVADAAAEQARVGGQDVAVVPTRSPVQGLAAVAVADSTRRFADDVIAMAEAAAATRFAEVTTAVRDAMTMAGRCTAGDVLGLADGDVVLIGADVTTVARDLLDRLLLSGGELATLVVGADAAPGLAAELTGHLHRRHPTVEAVVYHGGQPHYPLLLGIE